MTLPFDREAVRDLLLRWQRGEAGWQETVEAAEAFLDFDVPEIGRGSPASITLEAMELLARLHVDYLVRDDAPVLLRFLDTPAGSEMRGWAELDAFFESFDFEARARTWPAVREP